MFGILLWSLLVARDGNKLTSGLLFAILLNFKHIYMYLAPAYFVYLLRSYCLSANYEVRPMHFISLANTVIGVFLVSLGPFLFMGQLPQLLSRLFPFTRGLNHAYWAPNVWALVTFSDRVLLKVATLLRIPLNIHLAGVASTSRGLVGDTVFAVLPNVKPIHTFVITIACQLLFLVKLWLTPTYKSFITALTLCGYSSYMFGWHVHEKAILLVLVPLSLIAAESHAHFRTFVIASIAGIFSLFPLLFTPAETLIKVVYSSLWAVLILPPLNKIVYRFPRSLLGVIIDRAEMLYLAGFPLLQLFTTLFPLLATKRALALQEATTLNPALLELNTTKRIDTASSVSENTMEFLPLMTTSVYCAIGLVWSFIRLAHIYLRPISTEV
jgi:alpha-1,3-glucosyltransferase